MKFSNRDLAFYMAGVIALTFVIVITSWMHIIPSMIISCFIIVGAISFAMFLFRDKP